MRNNGELPETHTITDDILKKVAEKRGVDPNAMFFELGAKGYINMNREIIIEKREDFFAAYPEFTSGIFGNKITDVNKNKKRGNSYKKSGIL